MSEKEIAFFFFLGRLDVFYKIVLGQNYRFPKLKKLNLVRYLL